MASVVGTPVEQLSFKRNGSLRFYSQAETGFTGFRGHPTPTQDVEYTLPQAAPPLPTGYVLESNTNGTLRWVQQSGGGGGVPTTTKVEGELSVAGGGALTTDLKLKLLNDKLTPGNNQYYGTNSAGDKGYYAIPVIGVDEKFISKTFSTIGFTRSAPADDLWIDGVRGFTFELTCFADSYLGGTWAFHSVKKQGCMANTGSGASSTGGHLVTTYKEGNLTVGGSSENSPTEGAVEDGISFLVYGHALRIGVFGAGPSNRAVSWNVSVRYTAL